MSKNSLLAHANIRKAKGQTVAIIVLVLLSSLMMNLWLMLSMDYKKNFERCHDRLNDGHVNLAAYVTNDDFEKFASDMLKERSDITDFTVSDAFVGPITFEYNGGDMTSLAVLLEKDDALSRNVGKFEITEEGSEKSGIYLPMLYGTRDNYSIGDKFKVTLPNGEYEYTVCGFFNSAMIGSHNCNMMSLLFTSDAFKELSAENVAWKAVYASARVSDVPKSEEIVAALKDAIAKEFPEISVTTNNYQMITTSRYISQSICAGILSAMAFLVLLIGVVVICSNIANYIQENMPNLGALKAIGYTSRQIIASMIAQFVGIGAAAAVIGIGLSYLVFPAINEMMIAQTGIPYTVRFQPLPVLLTIASISIVVCAAVYLSARKIRKIEPIMAMRQGISTHSFKKNHVPLDSSSIPLNPALAMKTTLSGFKQNFTVSVTMLIISLVIVFAATMVRNVITDIQPMIDMIAGERADSAITTTLDIENEFVSALDSDSRVEKFFLFGGNNTGIQHVGGVALVPSVIDDCTKLNNQSMSVEGRFPKYDNEVSIAAKYGKDNNIKIGDEILLGVGNNQEKYIVSGYTQNSNALGKDCVITREGYEKLAALPNARYYIDLIEGADIDTFNDEMSERFGGDILSAINVYSIIESSGSVYVALVTMLVIAVVLISCIVIIFVMYLLVRTMLNNKKRDYGILKALGFTTGQLVLQTAMSFMPSVIISAAVGVAVSIPLVNPLLAVFLSGIGVVKGTFIIPVTASIVAGAGLILFAFGAACLMSLRVKKIAPRTLLSGE